MSPLSLSCTLRQSTFPLRLSSLASAAEATMYTASPSTRGELTRPRRRRKAKKLGFKPGTSANSCVNQPARFKDDVWTYDFVADRTVSGSPLKWLTLVDEYTRECLALYVAATVSGADVRRVLARVIGRRRAPQSIRSDNGSEFICV